MTAGFLESDHPLRSPLAASDARAKLVLTFGAVAVIASEPIGAWQRFPYYFALIAGLLVVGRTPPGALLWRLLAASPFILAAAATPLLSAYLEGATAIPLDAGLSMLLRAYAAVALLTFLLACTQADDLLAALQRLHAPRILSTVATLMYRYLFLLWDEWRRMSLARACRAAGPLRGPAGRFYAKQIALVLLRAWERAERVEAAMEARGFTGELPLRRQSRMRPSDWALLCVGLASFVAVRVAAPF